MTVFKTPAERRTWIDVRCTAVGDRFWSECQRLGVDGNTLAEKITWDCGIEIEKLHKAPRLAARLNASYLRFAALHGFDVQFVLSGKRSDNPVGITPYSIPNATKGPGGHDEQDAWIATHRRDIGSRMQAEFTRLEADPDKKKASLQAIEYLSPVEASALLAAPIQAARVPADFLSLLAERGMDTQYVLTGVRSANWPSASQSA